MCFNDCVLVPGEENCKPEFGAVGCAEATGLFCGGRRGKEGGEK